MNRTCAEPSALPPAASESHNSNANPSPGRALPGRPLGMPFPRPLADGGIWQEANFADPVVKPVLLLEQCGGTSAHNRILNEVSSS